MRNFLSEYKKNLINGFDAINPHVLEEIAQLIDQSIKSKKIIYTCGNGGSSSISDHFVCDFLKGVATNTNIQPIIHSLTSNTPTLTAIANDIKYDDIFSFQIERYGASEDLLLCVSSSGNSKNIINAIKKAKEKNIITISFVGFDGGEAKKLSDYNIHIPVYNYGVVEDIHHCLLHILSQYIRSDNLNSDANKREIIS